MNHTEATLLCRYVSAACPQQKFDEYTPDAWYDLLNDLDFATAKIAAAAVAKRRPFVAPSEIRAAASQIRRSVAATVRAEVEGDDPLPTLAEDAVAWRARTNEKVAQLTDRRILNGHYDLGVVDPFDDNPWHTPTLRPVRHLRGIES